MFVLSLLWLILGLCCALLVSLAQPIHHRHPISSLHLPHPLLLLLFSTLFALVIGWLGTWLYGRIAATALVLWVTPICIWLLTWRRQRRLAHP